MVRRKYTTESLIILISRTTISFVVFVIFLFSVPLYGHVKTLFAEASNTRIVIGESVISVGVADSNAERKSGLSNRETLRDNEGLLFIFPEPDFHGIWMNKMNFSIDIIWLDKTQQVVYIKKNVSPDTYPEIFKPTKKSLYVLEVSSGFVKKEGIKIGDQMTLFKN